LYLLVYNAVLSFEDQPTIRSRRISRESKQQALLGLFVDRDDGGDTLLQNVSYFQLATWRYNPEDRTLHNRRRENIKAHIQYVFV
jgi:hypothetical protein